MNAQELMIGDWVIRRNVPKEPMQVEKIDNLKGLVICSLDGLGITERICNIEPIPLTSEILEKNEFVKSERFDVWKIIEEHLEIRVSPWRAAIIFIDNLGSDEGEYGFPRPKYVHELQHALRLCGIEKEIVL